MESIVNWTYNPTYMLIVVSKDGTMTCSATMNPQAALSVKLEAGSFVFVTPITSWAQACMDGEITYD